MLNKSCFLLILFFFAIAITHAGEKETKSKQLIKGTIEKIDPSAKKLTVKREKKADLMEFSFSEDIYVWTKGKALHLEDLKVGDEVTVYYDTGTSHAEKIFVRPKKESSAK
jgi:Cu/Ag efflux protein CusF